MFSVVSLCEIIFWGMCTEMVWLKAHIAYSFPRCKPGKIALIWWKERHFWVSISSHAGMLFIINKALGLSSHWCQDKVLLSKPHALPLFCQGVLVFNVFFFHWFILYFFHIKTHKSSLYSQKPRPTVFHFIHFPVRQCLQLLQCKKYYSDFQEVVCNV